jgi:precorrin-6B methylase 2
MRNVFKGLITLALVAATTSLAAQGASTQKPKFEPTVGQQGKDVVWVPTPEPTVAKMLDMAKVTSKDFVMDLGSGDGRTVIAAAKRGARALGIEYNPDMVDLSRRNAEAAGVSAMAKFEQADLFATDFSKADVVTMFLLPSINLRLRDTILKMRPGTRIVSNTFTMDDWEADQTESVQNCSSWCTALLWIVPARVEGSWQMPGGTLNLTQKFQFVTGTLGSSTISNGRLRGAELTFTVGTTKYSGTVNGNTITGTGWTATRK